MADSDAELACKRTWAELRINGRGLDLASVTRALDIAPSRTHELGREDQYRSWVLSSRDHVVSPDLQAHLDWVLRRVERHAGAVVAYTQRSDRSVMYCYWEPLTTGGGGPFVNAALLSRMGALGLDIQVDISIQDLLKVWNED